MALEMGHLLEPLVAKIFQHRTGYKVYQIKKMFQHPKYPWMLADVDYFVELPDGTTAILEIKTTNYNAKDNWWLDGEETIPAYYESQGRHYMAVMDVDRCFFCCLYGNNEQESITARWSLWAAAPFFCAGRLRHPEKWVSRCSSPISTPMQPDMSICTALKLRAGDSYGGQERTGAFFLAVQYQRPDPFGNGRTAGKTA